MARPSALVQQARKVLLRGGLAAARRLGVFATGSRHSGKAGPGTPKAGSIQYKGPDSQYEGPDPTPRCEQITERLAAGRPGPQAAPGPCSRRGRRCLTSGAPAYTIMATTRSTSSGLTTGRHRPVRADRSDCPCVLSFAERDVVPVRRRRLGRTVMGHPCAPGSGETAVM
jgi:hypothetical protein